MLTKEFGTKLNDDFEKFVQEHDMRSALAYFRSNDGEVVALLKHNVTDKEIMDLIANLVIGLADKNGISSTDIYNDLIATTPHAPGKLGAPMN